MAAYLVVARDLFPSVAAQLFDTNDVWWMEPRVLVLFIVVFPILPLCLMKNIHSLRYSSILSLLAIFYLTSVVIVKSILDVIVYEDISEEAGDIIYFNLSPRILTAVPIFSMAFTFHMNIAPVYAELKNATAKRMNIVCVISISIGFLVYLIVGCFGYANFRNHTLSNILQNYNSTEPPILLGNIALCCVVCFVLPLVNYPLRGNLNTLFFQGSESNLVHVGLTLSGVFGAYIVSILGVDLAFLFGIVGTTVGALLVYVLPPAFFLVSCPERTRRSTILASTLLLTGISLSIMGTVAVIAYQQ